MGDKELTPPHGPLHHDTTNPSHSPPFLLLVSASQFAPSFWHFLSLLAVYQKAITSHNGLEGKPVPLHLTSKSFAN